ncbi:MAG: AAA family ATPase [Erysipelotrichaceae bacterium]|nr:AAA family ATPase [Erysipelotrichaceae bacterium]
MEEKAYSWIPFYSEFAEKLVSYENDRETLVLKIKNVFKNIHMGLPKLEDGELFDIDPFTVFGLFNKSITAANRIKIINGFKDEFSIHVTVPADFSGIPLVNNQNATFYSFGNRRGEHDIDHLWKVFESAYDYAKNKDAQSKTDFIQYYDICLNQRNIKWNITMGLFWMAPYTFLNLDSTNRDFILNINNMPVDYVESLHGLKHVLKGEEYLQLCSNTINILKNSQYAYKTIPDLSEYAWRTKPLEQDSNISSVSYLRWMKPILNALRKLNGSATPKEVRNQIIIDENLSDEEIGEKRGKNNVNKFENEVSFARNTLVYGGYISKEIRGVWTLTEEGNKVDMTPELASKIFQAEMRGYAVSKKEDVIDNDVSTVRYWIYAPGENLSMWDEFYQKGIMAIGWGELGDLRNYSSKIEMTKMMKEQYNPELSYKNSVHATWQFVHDLKENDIIFVKKGMHQIIGRGIVISDYSFDENRDDTYKNQRKVQWTHKGVWEYLAKQAPMKTLTDMTPYTDIVNNLKSLFEDETDNKEEIEEVFPIYDEEDFLSQVYMSKKNYHTLINLLNMKKNIILQGPPGVGKTYAAKRLAYSMIGEKNPNRVMMIQFHQSYAYEDFIEGYRPTENGFELRKGVFYHFCKDAEIDSENKYFFIIDEINRGNLSKIFCELFMLIENDKRGSKYQMRLLYSNDLFYVPDNVYIIGMMNTADRSLAMMDYALRRRFAFFEMIPAFDNDGFKNYKENKDNAKFNKLIDTVKRLNNEIENDDSLGSGFRIGHSYFCRNDEVTDEWMYSVVEYEIIPLLKEYWFDEPTKVQTWSDMLRGSISD